MTKSEMHIVMPKGIFDNAMIHNTISINELLLYTIVFLPVSKTNENMHFWASTIES